MVLKLECANDVGEIDDHGMTGKEQKLMAQKFTASCTITRRE